MIDTEFEAAAISWLTSKGYTVTKGAEDAVKGQDDFEDFWSLYPRKAGKEAARKSFGAAKSAQVMLGLCTWLEKNGFSSDPKYIPHASTWINQRRYLDAPEARTFKKPTQGPSGTRAALDAFLSEAPFDEMEG